MNKPLLAVAWVVAMVTTGLMTPGDVYDRTQALGQVVFYLLLGTFLYWVGCKMFKGPSKQDFPAVPGIPPTEGNQQFSFSAMLAVLTLILVAVTIGILVAGK